ncbi:HDOD domain-containing protein [Candidatus Symbiobacter mobilis]|uniref:Signal transduction protein n=1 Tax=Candidatus Symbiobacter mobilis CR TaxID=946483 RepID=U5N7K8_9BURK|nr:HDOD domain-containing protein [Candidatus Symbiobacter mobilis]AGX86278.1 signal transduction protein [Candidatus Symbiobacter mobilis CR]
MNNAVLDKLYAEMNQSRGVPALESTVMSILGSLHNIRVQPDHMAGKIVQDFALTQKVLRLANSPMYGPFAPETSSVTNAVRVLGSDALLHVVLNTSMATNEEMQQRECLAKILMASDLARNLCAQRAEAVSIATLMVDLGNLMTTTFLPEESALVHQKVVSGAEQDVAAIDVLGMTHQQVGIEVARHWGYPRSIVSIIDGTGDPTLVGVARFSNEASSLIRDGRTSEVHHLVKRLELPGIDKSSVLGWIDRKLDEGTLTDRRSRSVTRESQLEQLHKDVQQSEWTSMESLAGAIFAGLHQILHSAHCLLFTKMRSGDFRICYGYGKGIDELRSKIRIATTEHHTTAFHAVIRNNVDISIADVTKLKPSALPDGYTTLLPEIRRFVILPIANKSVSGLMYCDWDGTNTIGQADLVVVRKLRNLFLPFFPA